jgi:hypothetical protein
MSRSARRWKFTRVESGEIFDALGFKEAKEFTGGILT